MTPRANHKRLDSEGNALIRDLLQERFRLAIKHTLNQVLEEEIEVFVNAEPYQRTIQRQGYNNSHYPRDLVTTVGVVEDLAARARSRGGRRRRRNYRECKPIGRKMQPVHRDSL